MGSPVEPILQRVFCNCYYDNESGAGHLSTAAIHAVRLRGLHLINIDGLERIRTEDVCTWMDEGV